MRASASLSSDTVLVELMSCGRNTPAIWKVAQLVIHPQFLMALDHQIAVRQHLRHQRGDFEGNFSSRSIIALPSLLVVPVTLTRLAGLAPACEMSFSRPKRLAAPSCSLVVRLSLGLVVELRGVVEADQHGENVAICAAR